MFTTMIYMSHLHASPSVSDAITGSQPALDIIQLTILHCSTVAVSRNIFEVREGRGRVHLVHEIGEGNYE